MYIKNGQSISISKSKAGIENLSRTSGISDISEIKPTKKTEYAESQISADKKSEPVKSSDLSNPNSDSGNSEFERASNFSNLDIVVADKPDRKSKKRVKVEKTRKLKNKRYAAEPDINTKMGKIAEYLYNRKYYILLFSVIYIVGLIIGAVLVKNIDGARIVDLRNAVDSYFADAFSAESDSDIPARIINNIAADGALLFIAYLSGITVFAPLVCSAICLYKGLSCGYIIGVYISGGADLFHVAMCFLTFVFYLLTMLCFLLLCGESMGFSVFLLKSGESFRRNLSLRNIAVYSARYALMLALTAVVIAVQTIVIPFAYSVYY